MLKDLQRALQLLGRDTVRGARDNLKREKNNTSGNLLNSLKSRVIEERMVMIWNFGWRNMVCF